LGGQRRPAGAEKYCGVRCSAGACASYREEVIAAGAPSEEVLDSAEPEPTRRSRPWVVPVVMLLVVLAGLFGFRALQPDPVEEVPRSSTSAEPEDADPSLVDASARRLYGELPPTGAQSFSSAVSAATLVVRMNCRQDIESWAASLITSADSYDQATFLMRPANRALGTFVVQVELTWTVDHFSYAVVAGHVERCV